MTERVLLDRTGFDVPWGFRLQGGTDQNTPITVQRVVAGSVAATGLRVGDTLLKIGDADTSSLTGAAAMDLIKASGNRLQFSISRNECSTQALPAESVSTPDGQLSNGFGAQSEVRHPQSGLISNEDSRQTGSPINIRTASRPTTSACRPGLSQPGASFNRPRPDASFSPPRSAQTFSPPRSVQSFSPPQSSSPLLNIDDFGRPSPPLKVHRSQLQSRPHPSPLSTLQSQLPPLQSQLSPQQSPSIPSPMSNSPSVTVDLRSQKPFSYVPDFMNIPQQSNRLRQQRQRQQPVPRQPTCEALENNFLSNKEAAAAENRRLRRRGLLQQDSSTDSLNGPSANELSAGHNAEPEFDEAAYLSGRISILGGPPKQPFSPPAREINLSESREEEVEKEKPFDERAYLAGRIPLVQGGPIDPSTFNVPENRPAKKHHKESKPKLTTPFNEQAYLSGQISILGDPTHTAARPPRPKPAVVKASWMKSDQDLLSEDEYNEDSFLKGRINVVRSSIDRELPPRAKETRRPYNQGPTPRAAWVRDSNVEDNSVNSDAEFDEHAFLSGRRSRPDITSREQSVEGEGQNAPLRSIRYLRRSASNDKCLDSADEALVGITSFSEDEAGSDYDKTYKDFVYVGKKIPSRTFMKLQKTMARKSASERDKVVPSDSIERLKVKSLQGLDVNIAVEKLNIDKPDPEVYMELLKQSVQENDMKIEVEHESTDF